MKWRRAHSAHLLLFSWSFISILAAWIIVFWFFFFFLFKLLDFTWPRWHCVSGDDAPLTNTLQHSYTEETLPPLQQSDEGATFICIVKLTRRLPHTWHPHCRCWRVKQQERKRNEGSGDGSQTLNLAVCNQTRVDRAHESKISNLL